MINTNRVAVPKVIIQFSFSNSDHVPDITIVPELKQEIPFESHLRHNLSTNRRGIQIIAPTDKGDTSIEQFLEDLRILGYILVNAQSQKRYDYDKSSNGRDYWFFTVRYHFVHSSSAYISPKWRKMQASALESLEHIAKTSIWRIRVFSNPIFTNTGEEITNLRHLSVNAEVRRPLFDQRIPIMIYPRDTDGKKTGAPAVPLSPQFKLRILGKQVQRLRFL